MMFDHRDGRLAAQFLRSEQVDDGAHQYRDDRTAEHQAKKEENSLRYLQEMFSPWYNIETKIIAQSTMI